MSKQLFDIIRRIKGGPLTQGEVDDINRALAGEDPARVILPATLAMMHQFEGLRLKAYPDPGSKNGLPVTIGYGSTRDEQGKPIKLGDVWTEARADAVFARDVAAFAKCVDALIGSAPTTTNQFNALVSLAYNIGLKSLETSTLLRLHKEGNYAGAAAQFARWRFNDGKEMAGLVKRRAAEAALYRRADA